MRRVSSALVVGGLSVQIAISACGGGNAASKLVNPPKFDPEGQTKCSVTKSQERPLIVEWPSADRQDLEATIQNGVAIVSYTGCEMHVLDRCTAPSKYAYAGLTRAVDKVVIKDDDELYANLPVGAAKLEGELARSGQLTVGMNLVGKYRADKQTVRADELQGDCAGATHFVYGVSVGAFDFYSGGEANVGGGVALGIGDGGAGAHSHSERETLTQDGDPSACEKSAPGDTAPPAQCGALIRIEVVPLGEAKATAPTCPDATKWDGSQCVGGAPPSPAPAPSPTPGAPAGGSCPAGMASLRGGNFTMGDRKDSVTVGNFCLDQTEVTVDAYSACVRAETCTAADNGGSCNYGVNGRGNHPINCVDWGQSATYCHAQGKRLPTEEEWEWAARGGSEGRVYPWGNATPDFQLCWSGISKRTGTCAVGSLPAGDAPGGIHDLAGNVWEWTSSNFDSTGEVRVLRGGSWGNVVASNARAAVRSRLAPTNRIYNLGFRCAR